MKCKVCGRMAHQVKLGYMSMMWEGTVAVDGILCEACKLNIQTLINNYFEIKTNIENILKKHPVRQKDVF